MIDLNFIRKNIEQAKKLILRKEPTFEFDKLMDLDSKITSLKHKIEELRKDRNEISKKAASGLTDELRNKSIEIGKQIKEAEENLKSIEEEFTNLALSCPNIPQEDIPEGGKESNKPIKTIGKKTEFKFTPKNHIELNEINDWFDFKSAIQMSGSNFALYKPNGVKIIYALTSLMTRNNVKHSYQPIIPPYLVNEQALVNSGNLPKFRGDFYEMPKDDLCLIPTAEVSLTNMHANQILNEKELPKRYTSWTSCFRREAGSYGSEERGLIRIHQFEKVELYSVCKPEESNNELEKMLECAEDILGKLGLYYQVSLLATQDCSFASSKTYDIEVWLPGQNRFYEVSSCSNCTDFQTRRAKIRYRKDGKKVELVHTLNGSSLALPRLMVALMEQYQQEDGTIKLPKALQEEVDNVW